MLMIGCVKFKKCIAEGEFPPRFLTGVFMRRSFWKYRVVAQSSFEEFLVSDMILQGKFK